MKLGVNIDHVATLRQCRRGDEPDPVMAAKICERAGADSIVCHLREDRRHILDADVKRLRKTVTTRLNLEMALSQDILETALKVRPDQCTIVPERRQELTTEGGLDVIRYFQKITRAAERLQAKGITVSLFIAPEKSQITRAAETGVGMIELHTGCYANSRTPSATQKQLKQISDMTRFARDLGLSVNAGHGLNYTNTPAIAGISGIEELNIGHSIISRAVTTGLEAAVKDMIQIIRTST
ncbi:MAG TPA: pyridoxine 5'-phosphate synthase [Candidatus Omnitrophota bacterium]|nr:pyridoxine 5'-phosphate synthase [Candidatus Omnitrophota bacterium]HQO58866.1 pyridoxine 5'-phosphate synthase [Candidatus Omnitrophota bacterium]HQP11553.1 pyridoxine 5'-phosphate synthase [Candidatus Omnitrophota bacterium]